MNHLKIISKYLKRKNFIFRMPTIFIGDLPDDARQRDIEDFFRKYGRIEQIRLRNRFGFVDFRSQRDAEDAVRDLDGERMCGERVRLEISDGRRSGRRGSRDRGGSRDRYKKFSSIFFSEVLFSGDVATAGQDRDHVVAVEAAVADQSRTEQSSHWRLTI